MRNNRLHFMLSAFLTNKKYFAHTTTLLNEGHFNSLAS